MEEESSEIASLPFNTSYIEDEIVERYRGEIEDLSDKEYITTFLKTRYDRHYKLLKDFLGDLAEDIGKSDNKLVWRFENSSPKFLSTISAENVKRILEAKSKEKGWGDLEELEKPVPMEANDYKTAASNFLENMEKISSEIEETAHNGEYDFSNFEEEHYHSFLKAVRLS